MTQNSLLHSARLEVDRDFHSLHDVAMVPGGVVTLVEGLKRRVEAQDDVMVGFELVPD